MNESGKYLYKNRRKRVNYYACYTYEASDGRQYIYVKYQEDVKAIDLLLENAMQKQALMLADNQVNTFQ